MTAPAKEATSRADYIRLLVDAAPPLTDEQRARIRQLLHTPKGRA